MKVHDENYKKPSFGKIPSIECEFCKKDILSSSIKKHKNSCIHNPKNETHCKKCDKLIKPNAKFCDSSCAASYNNTNRTRQPWSQKQRNKQSKKISNATRKPSGSCKLFEHTCSVCGKFRLVNYKENQRKTCSRECRIFASTAIRPYQNGSRKTTWYFNKHQNKEVLLESSWEVRTAKLLDELDIEWVRPKHIKWNDKEGKQRLYFPDFLLSKTNVYLDPKNPYCMEQDKEKLSVVTQQIELIYGDINLIEEYIRNIVN